MGTNKFEVQKANNQTDNQATNNGKTNQKQYRGGLASLKVGSNICFPGFRGLFYSDAYCYFRPRMQITYEMLAEDWPTPYVVP